jgi:hypothetical protein
MSDIVLIVLMENLSIVHLNTSAQYLYDVHVRLQRIVKGILE